jgi:hypothetical protein
MHPKSSQFPISHVKVIPQKEQHGVSDKMILASQKYANWDWDKDKDWSK